MVRKAASILFYNGRAQLGAKFTKLNATEIKNEFGFEYMFSSLSGSLKLVKSLIGDKGEALFSQYNFLEKAPEEVFIVHKISDKIGWSLTTAIPLKKNTFILEYVGEQIPYTQNTDFIYQLRGGYSTASMEKYTNAFKTAKYKAHKDKARDELIEKLSYGVSLPGGVLADSTVISAKTKGNLARFLTHLPDEPEHPDIKPANLDLEMLPAVDGRMHGFFITKKDIKAFEELGWDYGSGYLWGEDQPQYLHTTTGDIYSRPVHDEI